jgi:hypothetical protein
MRTYYVEDRGCFSEVPDLGYNGRHCGGYAETAVQGFILHQTKLRVINFFDSERANYTANTKGISPRGYRWTKWLGVR